MSSLSSHLQESVQRSGHSQHHGSVHTERRMSVTLFIVTVVSVHTILPWAVYKSMLVDPNTELSNRSRVEFHIVLPVIYFASSMVNPLVYAIRMHEFKKVVRNFVC